MAIVNKVDLKMQVDIDISSRYQILTYCFFNDILISNSDLKFLAELSKVDDIELNGIDQLHVTRGAATVQYGNGAGGAINISTKNS